MVAFTSPAKFKLHVQPVGTLVPVLEACKMRISDKYHCIRTGLENHKKAELEYHARGGVRIPDEGGVGVPGNPQQSKN